MKKGKKNPRKEKEIQKTTKTSSFHITEIIKRFWPIVLVIIAYFYYSNIFGESKVFGKYTVKNTVALYFLIFSIGIAIILIIFKKWSKILLFNWILISLIVVIFESYYRITNSGNVLNYSEINSGFFTTEMSSYKNILKKRVQGDYLYMHSEENPLIVDKPEFKFQYALDKYKLNNCPSCNKKDAKYRILTLGDSFTFGIGAEPKKSWPNQLDSLFTVHNIQDVSICNGATSGADPIYMLDIYKHIFKEAFHPNILIVAMNLSDLKDIIIRGGENRYQLMTSLDNPTWLPYYASSLIYRKYKFLIDDIDPNLLIPKQKIDNLSFSAYDEIFKTMLRFRNESYIQGIRVIFLYNPSYHEIQSYSNEFSDIIAEARNQGMEFIDLSPFYQEYGITPENVFDYFWKEDYHNNAKGYEIWAKSVYSYLTNNKVVD